MTIILKCLLLILASLYAAGCGSKEYSELAAGSAGRTPETVTGAARAYGDCTLGDAYGPYTGDNYRGHAWPPMQLARCRHLLPGNSGVGNQDELRRCLDDHLRWAVLRYELTEWPKGFRPHQARVYAEAVCAPSPPGGPDTRGR